MRVLLIALTLTILTHPADGQHYVHGDRGGMIGTYIDRYSTLRMSGQMVVFDGPCLSACTLALGLLPTEQMCATEKARFGFHAAWMPDSEGRPMYSPLGSKVLLTIYPPSIRKWIMDRGGLNGKMMFLRGSALYKHVPRCGRDASNHRAEAR